MQRRHFLAGGVAGLLLPGLLRGAPPDLLRRPLGDGRRVPAVGLGSWRTFDLTPGHAGWAPALETLRRFVAGGGEVVDSSPMYGQSSEVIGQMAESLAVTEKLFFASKIWTRGRAAGRAQLEREAERFGIDQLDLMQVHNLSDLGTQLAMLREAKQQGRVARVGISHYLTSSHAEVERVLRSEKIDVLQINLSMIEPEAEARLLPLAAERGVAVFANRVFAEGALFGRVRGKPLPGIAAELGITSWAQFFIKWVLARPEVSVVLTGTGNPEHIVDNLQAASGPLPDAAMRKQMRDALLAL